ncbi:HSP20-like chaperone [Nitzschia inconspicua]|uniref:Nuclear migration protein nudC n=1 Tax=Nitzschia inconspicua TaxID=303405 RepID=A0A9K3M0D2_9STRA|nr:HSP20-like chaperone [Nitzschia inconspicua]
MSFDGDDDPRFDGLYMNVAQTTHGIEPLLDTVFGFLRRKTDFFAGPPGASDGMAAAIAKVNEVLQKHADRYQKEHRSQSKTSNNKNKKTTTPTPTSKQVSSSTTTVVEQPFKKPKEEDEEEEEEIVEMGSGGDFDISKNQKPTEKPIVKSLTEEKKTASNNNETTSPDTTATPPSTSISATVSTGGTKDNSIKNDDDEDEEEDNSPPPVGNGGTVPGKYVWTQTLAEVMVTVPVPDHTRGRDLQVTIGRSHLKVVLKAAATEKRVLVDADLTKTVIMDDSFWTVEDGNRLVINLQKQNQMEWWDSVCKGDPTINVRKINPENSSLSDLDGETRKTVEKMMFDQRQKALGLPTSDEQSKLDVLENFKKQHPELDFSNAKIN